MKAVAKVVISAVVEVAVVKIAMITRNIAIIGQDRASVREIRHI